MILESLEYCDRNKNSGKIIKAIHVIDLTNEGEINIGKKPSKNDIIIDDFSVCPEHAVIIYKDGKLLLKNKSLKSGTLVLNKKSTLKLSEKEKEMYLQVDKTFIEAKIMEEKEFLDTKKNDETKYPILDINNKNISNEENIQNNNQLELNNINTEDSSQPSFGEIVRLHNI